MNERGSEDHKVEELYRTYKPLLFSIAYRMLGRVTDAEDAVQETFAQRIAVQSGNVRDEKAYLCRSVTNRCIDRLRSSASQREVYVGPWLPEPLVGSSLPGGDIAGKEYGADPADELMRKESLTTAYLLLLEQLSPVERAVFLLREVLQFEYAELAEMVGKSEANCRQIFHRAKRAVSSGTAEREEAGKKAPDKAAGAALPRGGPSSVTEAANQLVLHFVQALTSADIPRLAGLLAADARLYSDGGGQVKAALRPILGAERVVAFLLAVLAKAPDDFSVNVAEVNGLLGVVTQGDGQPSGVISFRIEDNRIADMYLVANPDKLSHLAPL